jgi:nitronate monooxygenase
VYVSKGGQEEATAGRKCLCNALLANIGIPQIRGGKYMESGMVTTGDDVTHISGFLQPDNLEYSAGAVIAKLRGEERILSTCVLERETPRSVPSAS